MKDEMKRAAERAGSRPFFLAGAMETYRQTMGLGESELAAYLGCGQGDLPLVGLCRRPGRGAEGFGSDVARISIHFGLQRHRLAEMLRLVEVLEGLRVGAEAGKLQQGLLAAARDQCDEHEDDDSEENQ